MKRRGRYDPDDASGQPCTGCYEPTLEHLSTEALAELQLARLKDSLARAEQARCYCRRLADAGIGARDLASLDDLARFPFTDKDDLRRAYPFGAFAVPRHRVARLHASSGTTGTPTVIGYTAGDIDRWAGLMARSLYAAGARPGDIVHNTHGYGLFTGGLGVHYGAERLGCTVVPVSGGGTARQVQLIGDFGAAIIVGTPSYVLHIAEVARDHGVDLAVGTLRVGLFGGEPWCEELRGRLEAELGIRAHDLYGLGEMMGPGVASECIERAGLHVWEDHFLVEIVDPTSGERLPPGSTGELVVTTLTREAMPLIRYRTRDVTRMIDAPCACGRGHRRIAKISGRADDMLIVRGVNVYPSQIEAALAAFGGFAAEYRLRLARDGALDSLTVEVEYTAGCEGNTELGPALAGRIKSLVGINCDIQVHPPGTLPRSTGKARRILDLRNKGGRHTPPPGVTP